MHVINTHVIHLQEYFFLATALISLTCWGAHLTGWTPQQVKILISRESAKQRHPELLFFSVYSCSYLFELLKHSASLYLERGKLHSEPAQQPIFGALSFWSLWYVKILLIAEIDHTRHKWSVQCKIYCIELDSEACTKNRFPAFLQ